MCIRDRYEAGQRHADIVIQELGLKEAKVVTSPSCKEDADRVLTGAGSPLPPAEATQYRALAARLNYRALDRTDMQFATKEVAKYMATPHQAHWILLKRLARYLIGAPRFVQK